jgi:chromosomal replication initiation ATPase DnaA
MTPLEKATSAYQYHAAAMEAAAREIRALTLTGVPPPARPEVQVIQRAVAGHYRMAVELLWSSDRHEPYTTARAQAMALCRKLTTLTLVEIGQAFRRNHGCVLNAVHVVENRCATEARYRAQFEALLAECQAGHQVDSAA